MPYGRDMCYTYLYNALRITYSVLRIAKLA
jgi:hypothetical protein